MNKTRKKKRGHGSILFFIGIGGAIILFLIACFVKGTEKIYAYVSGRKKSDVADDQDEKPKSLEAAIFRDQEIDQKKQDATNTNDDDI